MSEYEAIADLVTRLWADIDLRDGASAHLYFAERARLTFDARSFVGRDEIAKVYRDRKARGPRLSRHVVNNLIADCGATGPAGPTPTRPGNSMGRDWHGAVNPGEAHVRHVCTLYAFDGVAPGPTTAPTAVADVTDALRRAGPGEPWLIAERVWQTVFIAPGTAFAVPTK